MELKSKYQFIITGISWQDYTPKIIFNCAKLHSLLNEYLDLYDYGTSVHKLAFAFIVQKPDSNFHEEMMIYEAEAGKLYGQFELLPSFIETRSEEEVLSIMAYHYLERMIDFAQLEIENFNWYAFQESVSLLFQEAGLVEVEEVI